MATTVPFSLTGASATGADLMRRIQAFDPAEAARRATDAAVATLFEQFGDDFRRLRGEQVGAGRLNTGFAALDEADLTRMFADRIGNVIAQNALAASRLDLENIGNLGSLFGQQLNFLTANRELDIARENARRQERAANRSSWLSTLGALGGAAILAFSDERLKTRIETVGRALDEIRQLRGVEWDWNEEGRQKTGRAGRERGVLAQDVERVRPDLVYETPDGTKMVNYGTRDTGLVGTLVEATKEIDRRIAAIEAELSRFKQRRAA